MRMFRPCAMVALSLTCLVSARGQRSHRAQASRKSLGKEDKELASRLRRFDLEDSLRFRHYLPIGSRSTKTKSD